jgi:hypothetical protein
MSRINFPSSERFGVWRGGLLRADLRESEIENFGVAALSDEDVGGLDVPVDDAFGVRGVERVGALNSNFEEAFDFHGPAGDGVLQCLSGQVLHGDETAAIVFANFVNGADVGIEQRQRGLRGEIVPRACASCARSSGRNFSATKRPSSVSSAL